MQSESQDKLSRFLASPSAASWEALKESGLPSPYGINLVMRDQVDSSSLERAQKFLDELKGENSSDSRVVYILNLVKYRISVLTGVSQLEAQSQIEPETHFLVEAEHSSEPQPESESQIKSELESQLHSHEQNESENPLIVSTNSPHDSQPQIQVSGDEVEHVASPYFQETNGLPEALKVLLIFLAAVMVIAIILYICYLIWFK